MIYSIDLDDCVIVMSLKYKYFYVTGVSYLFVFH